MDAFDDGMGIWVPDSDGMNPRKVVDKKGTPTWLPPSNDRFTFISDGLKLFEDGEQDDRHHDRRLRLRQARTPRDQPVGDRRSDAQTATERVLIPHDKWGQHFFWLPTISPDGKQIMFIHD
jgi:hypothetical protein